MGNREINLIDMTESDINSAALFINNTLVSQGFIKDSERLVFGARSEDDEDALSDADNDRRIINVIYGLLNKIERDSKTRETAAVQLKETQRELERETAKVSRLNAKLDACEKQVWQAEHKNNALQTALAAAKKSRDEFRTTFSQLKLVVQKSRLQCANELRKRDMEISRLKERLLDPKKVKTVTGISGTLSKSYNSFKSTAGGGANTVQHNSGQSAKESTVQEVVRLNQQLVLESSTLLDMLYRIYQEFIDMVYSPSLAEKIPELSAVGLPDSAGVSERALRAEELGQRIVVCIEEVRNIIYSPDFVSISEMREKEKEISDLREQLRDMTANWQKAMNSVEEWKKYLAKAEKRDTIRPGPPRVRAGVNSQTPMGRRTQSGPLNSPSKAKKSEEELNIESSQDAKGLSDGSEQPLAPTTAMIKTDRRVSTLMSPTKSSLLRRKEKSNTKRL